MALTELREAAKLQQKDAASEVGCSTSKISRIEAGKGLVKPVELRALLDLYGVTDETTRTGLLDLAKRAAEVGWWEQSEYESIMPAGLGVYVGLEHDARTVRAWEIGFVNGLLQHDDYAQAVVESDRPRTPEAVQRLLEIRQKRQSRLTAASDPLEIWTIMDESVLMRPVGSSRVMLAQIRHIQEMSELPNVTVQIYPLGKGVHRGLRGSVAILEFGPGDSPVVYLDSPAGNVFVERDNQVREILHDYHRLTAGALDPKETRDRLHQAAKEYGS
ncbi:helix-turn-helix domain-containing protein [Kitasatospora sp. NBC_01302]|uniref:helix-turn-helix domain-containing protein n=1 Tax=Kitasatospora sp. NBC_01302 TaxID=2903575 RepID=UPI002E0F51E6|nr:helix-turn-helix domain-containing protein [Kitasatospora sp. NBC_01302]